MQQESAGSETNIFYVSYRHLGAVKEKIKRDYEITKEDVEVLTDPWLLFNDEVMVPIDMSVASQHFVDTEDLLKKLGPKGAAETLIKAEEKFGKGRPT